MTKPPTMPVTGPVSSPVTNVVEALGFGLVLVFLWFVWAPLVLLGAGVLLVVWANTRTRKSQIGAALGAAIAAARRAYAANHEQPKPGELRPVA